MIFVILLTAFVNSTCLWEIALTLWQYSQTCVKGRPLGPENNKRVDRWSLFRGYLGNKSSNLDLKK
jgi:hypothetical protein